MEFASKEFREKFNELLHEIIKDYPDTPDEGESA